MSFNAFNVEVKVEDIADSYEINNKESDHSYGNHVIEEEIDIGPENVQQSAVLENARIGDIMSELKEIRSLVTYAIQRVENVEKLLQNERGCQTQQNLLPNLPLNELTQLEAFEAKLADKRIEQQLFDNLKYTGGSRERDCVNRCLEKVFSNYLAQFCSWTGKKQNFRLSTLKLMATLKLAVKESYPTMTDESFERHVMSWFQHATTRLKRLSELSVGASHTLSPQ